MLAGLYSVRPCSLLAEHTLWSTALSLSFKDNLLTSNSSWHMLKDNYFTLSLIQSLPAGCLKEVLNHNKYLQLRARWQGQLWHLISFFFLFLSRHPLSVCPSVWVSIWAWGKQADALEERGEGRNQSHRLILLTMLSLGERQAVANGQRMEQDAEIWITALRGAHILLWDRTAATWTVYPQGASRAPLLTRP